MPGKERESDLRNKNLKKVVIFLNQNLCYTGKEENGKEDAF